MSSSIDFKNILVVGVGLIGGSIIRALKDNSFSGDVYGIDSNKENWEKYLYENIGVSINFSELIRELEVNKCYSSLNLISG